MVFRQSQWNIVPMIGEKFDWEGREPMSKGPAAGKVKPGAPLRRGELWEVLRCHKPYNLTPAECLWDSTGVRQRAGALWFSIGQKPLVTEEPDEGNLHVRICGRGGW